MTNIKKKLLIACSAIAGLLIVSVLALVLFVDANQFRPHLEQTMGEALGRKVTIGNIKAALLSAGSRWKTCPLRTTRRSAPRRSSRPRRRRSE